MIFGNLTRRPGEDPGTPGEILYRPGRARQPHSSYSFLTGRRSVRHGTGVRRTVFTEEPTRCFDRNCGTSSPGKSRASPANGRVPRDFRRKLGELGIFRFGIPPRYGCAGPGGFAFDAVITEEYG
ncbi:acyl-CoA dehydrogenase family protein [Streptomyces sp. NPDC020141]